MTAPLATPVYISVKATKHTGRWFLACPMFYSKWTTSENITRSPIPVETGPTTDSRGFWRLTSTNSEVTIKTVGWLAMSIVLPDPSVSNGHLDYAGVGSYKIAYLLNLDCGTCRLRVAMSDTYDRLAATLSDGITTIAHLSFPADWNGYAAMGAVVTWEINNGNTYATLYVNGIKVDSTFNPVLWYSQGLPPATLWVGANTGGSSSSADCYISKIVMGRKYLHKRYARTLSAHMRTIARGQII
jgi:hypothetical protein